MFTNADGTTISLIGTLSLLGWGLGYFGQPHILARFKGISSKDHVPTARRIAVAWSGLSMAGSVLIGLFAIAYLTQVLRPSGFPHTFLNKKQEFVDNFN